MSSRSKSSSSSIQSNGSASTSNDNCARSSQPLITRPYSSTITSSGNSSNRSKQCVRSSQPSKKSTITIRKNQLNAQNSSLSLNKPPSRINRNRVSHTALSGNRGSSTFGIKSYINDPTCISLRQQLMDCDDPSEIYDQLEDVQLQKLVTHLKEYEQDNALSENYIEASKSRNLSIEIHEILKIRKKNEINESFFATSQSTSTVNHSQRAITSNQEEEEEFDASGHYSNNNSNMKDLNNNEKITATQVKEFDQFYQDKIKKYQKETTKKIDKLNESHEQQIIELEKLWKEKKPAQYRKPSANLLQLKTIEKNLAMTGEYERAMILHKETESLTRKEMIDAQKMLVYDYKLAKSKLLEKQNSELNQLQQSRQEGLIMLQNKHKLKRQQYENRDKVLQQQKNALASKMLNQATQSLSLPAPIMTEKLGSVQYNLLPKLTPPNDTDFVKEEERKTKEDNKKKLELQKKNIKAISQIYKCKNEYENNYCAEESDNKNGDQKRIIDKNTEKDQKIQNDDQKIDDILMEAVTETIEIITGEDNDHKEKVLELAENNGICKDKNEENKDEIKTDTVKKDENKESTPETEKSENLENEQEDRIKELKSEEEASNSRSEAEENRKGQNKECKSEAEEDKKSEEETAKSKSEVEQTEAEDKKSIKSEVEAEEATKPKSETEEDTKSEQETKSKSETETDETSKPKSETEEDKKSEEETAKSRSETETDETIKSKSEIEEDKKSEEEATKSKSETEEDKKSEEEIKSKSETETDETTKPKSETEEDKKSEEEIKSKSETETDETAKTKSETEEDKKSEEETTKSKSETEENHESESIEDKSKELKPETDEDKKSIKSEEENKNSNSAENKEINESKEEENKETKSEPEENTKETNKTALDMSLISSLIGSADPKGHEKADEETK